MITNCSECGHTFDVPDAAILATLRGVPNVGAECTNPGCRTIFRVGVAVTLVAARAFRPSPIPDQPPATWRDRPPLL